MPLNSRWSLDIPQLSISSFIFTSPSAELNDTNKIIIDAKRPGTHHYTLYTLRKWSTRFAAGLVAAGFRPGDRLMLFSSNSIFTPVVVLGVVMAGGIYTSANPAYTPRELAYQMNDCEPRFVLAESSCWDRAYEGADFARLHKGRVYLFEEVPLQLNEPVQSSTPGSKGRQHWGNLIADPAQGYSFRWDESLCHETALLVYSSGTTGLPKGVELSHYNIVANTCQIMKVQLSDETVRARRGLCCIPMYHGLGLVYYILVAPKAGIQTFMMERWALSDLLCHIEEFKITELVLVPPMLVMMAKNSAVRSGKYDLSSVRKVLAGAAPIGREVTEEFEELWSGKLRVRQAWGMSEAPCISMCWDERESSGATSISVGELVPGVEAMIRIEGGGEQTEPFERGEIWVRGPNIMKGYWRNPKATADTFTEDGWLQTGDVAYRDEQGKFYMVDRKKELIKVRGVQVAPAELEALLLEHPQIVDAAVIGVKAGVAGDEECPRAYVVCRHENAITEEEVIQFVSEKVSKSKRLTGGVVFVDSIPKNPSGKILRKILREVAARDAAGEGLSKARL